MDIDIRKQQLRNDNLQRINTMKCLIHESETVGIGTLIRLADQSEQLKDIDSHLSTLDGTLISTKKDLNRLKQLRQNLLDILRSFFSCVSQRTILSKLICNSTTPSLKQVY